MTARRRDPVVVLAAEDVSETNVMTAALSEAGLRVEAQPPEACDDSDGFDGADLLVMDADCPRADSVLGALARQDRRPPFVLLSRESGARAVARALDGGADDYLVKPVHPDELTARVRAVLRRTMPDPELGCLDLDGVHVDLDRRLATRSGEAVPLSRVEWLLLERLALDPGAIVRHETLVFDVWGLDPCESGRWLRVWVGRLRRRLGWKAGSGGAIETIPGVGYRLAERWLGDRGSRGGRVRKGRGAATAGVEGEDRRRSPTTPTASPAAPPQARSR